MAGVNRVILLGNIGAKPELKYTSSGTPVLQFRLATTRWYRDQNDEWKDVTQWHTLVYYGPEAEKIEPLLDKGTQIYAEGELVYRTWETERQEKRTIAEVRVLEMEPVPRTDEAPIQQEPPVGEDPYQNSSEAGTTDDGSAPF